MVSWSTLWQNDDLTASTSSERLKSNKVKAGTPVLFAKSTNFRALLEKPSRKAAEYWSLFAFRKRWTAMPVFLLLFYYSSSRIISVHPRPFQDSLSNKKNYKLRQWHLRNNSGFIALLPRNGYNLNRNVGYSLMTKLYRISHTWTMITKLT